MFKCKRFYIRDFHNLLIILEYDLVRGEIEPIRAFCDTKKEIFFVVLVKCFAKLGVLQKLITIINFLIIIIELCFLVRKTGASYKLYINYKNKNATIY